ncbi:hypothetical protein TSOC_013811, partial [Tetrabaena socialis]
MPAPKRLPATCEVYHPGGATPSCLKMWSPATTSAEEAPAPAVAAAPSDVDDSAADYSLPGIDDDEDVAPKLCQGKTPAKVVIDRVVAYPAANASPLIVLRNVGGQTANLTGWRLTDSDTRTVGAAMNLIFGAPSCTGPSNVAIDPSRTLTLQPKNESNPCGFPFGISFRDEVNLFDPAGKLVATAKWPNAEMGTALHLQADGSYDALSETVGVMDVLRATGRHKIFLDALVATGLDKKLVAPTAADYQLPEKPTKQDQQLAPQFPWWFGFGV